MNFIKLSKITNSIITDVYINISHISAIEPSCKEENKSLILLLNGNHIIVKEHVSDIILKLELMN